MTAAAIQRNAVGNKHVRRTGNVFSLSAITKRKGQKEVEDLTLSMKRYIQVIYHLQAEAKVSPVRVLDIAKETGFSKASVSYATDILARRGLLNKNKFQSGITLTEQGLKLAAEAHERTIVIRDFLQKVLNLDLGIATQDAQEIEQIISENAYQAVLKGSF